MMAELQGGAAIFQTIDDHWQLSTSIRSIVGTSNLKFIFKLHFKSEAGDYKVNLPGKMPGSMPGSVEWGMHWRPRNVMNPANFDDKAHVVRYFWASVQCLIF
jgi:hypothetical protein